MNHLFRGVCAAAAFFISIGSAAAQPAEGWTARVGVGALLSPAFQGARTYQLNGLPSVRLAYGERFFLSVEEGLGYAALDEGPFSAGPIVRMAFGRDEDGGGPFRIAGRRSDALRGLGDISTGVEGGAFARYRAGNWSAALEVRHGVGGHDDIVANLSLSRLWRIGAISVPGAGPAFISLGPRAAFAGRRYAQTYFGVDARQAAASGLAPYAPRGGLMSVGASGVLILPVAPRTAVNLIAGYERLGAEAARSPIVRDRGSRHQAVLGLFASYQFSWQ